MFGGDYIYASSRYLQDALKPFENLNPPLGMWGILGNHDNYLNPMETIKKLRESNIEPLVNSSVKIITGEEILNLFGFDDYKTGRLDLEKTLKHIKGEGIKIGLSHNPLFWKKYSFNFKIDLMLSGHTHGGQINIPFLGPFFLLPSHGRELYKGIYKIKNSFLYVSRGIGTIHLPIRFLCPPEITVIKFCAKI